MADNNKQEILGLSKEGRSFVEEYHDYIEIAQQYLDFWNRY